MAAPLVAAAGRGAMRLLSNKWFWIILGSIVALILIRRYWGKISSKVGSRLGPQYGDWQEGTITDGRKKELEKFAQNIYDVLACGYCMVGAEDDLLKAAALNDNELEYLARFYEQYVSDNGETLYEDVDDEWLPATDADEDLLTKLDRLGLK